VIGAIAVFFVTGELPLSVEEIRVRLKGVFPFGFALFCLPWWFLRGGVGRGSLRMAGGR
jgi:hypothetical protein